MVITFIPLASLLWRPPTTSVIDTLKVGKIIYIDEGYFLEILRAPVQIEERLDDVSIDKALAGLVLLVTGHGTGVKRGFVQFLQSYVSPLERSPD